MFRKSMIMVAGICVALAGNSELVKIESLKYTGPVAISSPVMVDSVDVNSKAYNAAELIDTPVSLDLAKDGSQVSDEVILLSGSDALHLLSFTIDNSNFVKGKLNVEGVDKYQIYLNGKKSAGNEMTLTPATHEVVIKASTRANQPDTLRLSIETEHPEYLNINSGSGRRYTLDDVMRGKRMAGVAMSPSGKYMIRIYSFTHDNGNVDYTYAVYDNKSDKRIYQSTDRLNWWPNDDKIYFTRKTDGKTDVMLLSLADLSETKIAGNLPASYFTVSPTEDFLVYTHIQQGPAEKSKDLYEIIHPDDRQPGWRNRGQLMKYDLKTGLTTPLTFGNRNVSFNGISNDGKRLLYTVTEYNLTKRPTTLFSLWLMDLADNKAKLIAGPDGFISNALLSPDGAKIAVIGSPEAFDGVGNILPDSVTPSMYDYQLYIVDAESGKVDAVTRDFNPSIDNMVWSENDGMLYFVASDKDLRSLYRLNSKTGKIENLKAAEEYVTSYSLADNAPIMAYYGQGSKNSDKLYTLDTQKLRHQIKEDLSAMRLKDIKLGEVMAWDYVTSRGDTINARYVLPADFDASKKYPVIVNYYGGCTPTSRTMESRYPHHLYAANGYVVLVINPSGAAGFGQEFSSRHVNTAGKGVAEDIIEGVQQFIKENPWVDAEKIGCIGASYGGFMTQYLQTQTDLFAAAISHAGISDHTSYWGEGYWGYSYSEVSMANSYPWTRRDLFVEQSPLFNVEKINTPILFLHGDSDTNVPVGESIQMYNAMRLLGKDAAFVAVKDANHQVTEYNKRHQWQDTIFAWFAKYLKGDDSWWQELYPDKAVK